MRRKTLLAYFLYDDAWNAVLLRQEVHKFIFLSVLAACSTVSVAASAIGGIGKRTARRQIAQQA